MFHTQISGTICWGIIFPEYLSILEVDEAMKEATLQWPVTQHVMTTDFLFQSRN